MVIGHGILGFRDPNGIRRWSSANVRPKKAPNGCWPPRALRGYAGFDMVRDVAPGEAVFIDEQGRFYAQQCPLAMARHTPCIFEYVYFARPDSIIDNISVYKARLAHGRAPCGENQARTA